jgi:hypothetical protein
MPKRKTKTRHFNKLECGILRRAQAGTHTHTQVQAATCKRAQNHADSRRHTQAHAGTGRHTQTHAHTRRHRQAQAGTYGHPQAQASAGSTRRHKHYFYLKKYYLVIALFLFKKVVRVFRRKPMKIQLVNYNQFYSYTSFQEWRQESIMISKAHSFGSRF